MTFELSNESLERLRERAAAAGLPVDELLNRLLDGKTELEVPASLFQRMPDETSDTITLLDLDLRYVYVNPIMSRLTGLDVSQMIDRTNHELGMPEEQVRQWKADWQEVIDSRREKIITFDFVTSAGMRSYESRLSPLLDDSGAVQYLLAVTRDITERKLADEQLRRSEANLRAMLNSSWSSFMLIDRHYQVMDIDKKGKEAAERIFEKPMYPGVSVYDFVFPHDLEGFNAHFSRALGGESVTLEKMFKGVGGGTFFFEITYYPVTDQHGDI